jgi:hypothetical protein
LVSRKACLTRDGARWSLNNRGAVLTTRSTMSRRIGPGTGQHVPADDAERPTRFEPGGPIMVTMPKSVPEALAGWLLIVFGGLVLAHTAVSSGGAGITGSDWSFALLVALSSFLIARSLWLEARWAWWASLGYGVVGLFFVLPVTLTILFGASTEPVGTGWDPLLFPLITAVMVTLLAALWLVRRNSRRHEDRSPS